MRYQMRTRFISKPFKQVVFALALTISYGCLLLPLARADVIEVEGSAEAYGVSGDGNVVVGVNSGYTAIKWEDGVLTPLDGSPGGTWSHAYAASYDGNVIVGAAGTADNIPQAVRWVAGTPDFFLNDSETYSYARDVSADGTIVVGDNQNLAYLWNATTDELTYLMDSYSEFYGGSARGVSANGSVVVGLVLKIGNPTYHAFSWTFDEGPVDLGTLDGHSFSYAEAVSDDGTVIVGVSEEQPYREAVVWTLADGIVGLGRPDGTYSVATDVSADGSVIVGYDDYDATDDGMISWEAVRWTGSGTNYTMQSINNWLTENGITVGWQELMIANGISDDGTVVVGTGVNASGNTEGFIATVAAPAEDPEDPAPPAPPADPPTGIIGTTDFTNSLGDVNRGRALGHKINGLMGQTVSSFAFSGPGIIAEYLQGKTILSPVALYAEGSKLMAAGVAAEHVTDAISLRVAVIGVDAEDDGRYNGDVELSGYSLGLALDIYPGKMVGSSVLNPFNITIGYGRGFYEGDFDRTYLNGATPETANGDPDVNTMSTFIEAGWLVPLSATTTVRPYVELFYQKTDMDSYTETGGSFSGTVASQDESNTRYSFGVQGAIQVNDHFKVGADVAAVKLRDDQGPDLSVNVPGIGVFVYEGVDYDDTWGELALNAQWNFTSNFWLRGEVRGTTGSDYPEDWSSRVELSYAF